MVAKPGNAMNQQGARGIVTWDGTSIESTQALTQYDVLTGGSTASTINQVAPSATSGVPLISQGSTTQPTFGTAVVAGGGTGDTSFTAYMPITGGTSTTGALQSVATGTAGQFLAYVSSSALPAWTGSGTGVVTKVNVQTFTASGTYTPTTNMQYCIAEGVSAGGGGGGAASTGATTFSVGGGGGAGEYGRVLLTASQVGANQSVTIASGGAGGSAGSNGTSGSSTSLGSLLVLNGGTHGIGGAATTSAMIVTAGGAGGTSGTSSAGVSFFAQGGGGGFGIGSSTANSGQTGAGGNSYFGCGAVSTTVPSPGHSPAEGYGGGGSGAVQGNSDAGQTGGAGTGGIIVITEYCT